MSENTSQLFLKLQKDFTSHNLNGEDDIKVHFYADVLQPMINYFSPEMIASFKSEASFFKGGRADATIQNISFEYKDYAMFDKKKGVDEALFGRNLSGGKQDRGLHDYIISNAEISSLDPEDVTVKKLLNGYGVGFDGKSFLFARYVPTAHNELLDVSKTQYKGQEFSLPVKFSYEHVDFNQGLYKLALLFQQSEKLALTKGNLLNKITPKSKFVQDSIWKLYNSLDKAVTFNPKDKKLYMPRVATLFDEWDRVFGTLYGNEDEETDFTSIIPAIKELYNIPDEEEIDYKKYLFSLQTFFNIFLKLLVNSFLSRLINPMFAGTTNLGKTEITALFSGKNNAQNKFVKNFFEWHFLEWFTFKTYNDEDIEVVNDILNVINEFDMSTFVLKPEAVQDILQETYMELIPKEVRHIMGEYFSPDWAVERVLDNAGFTGEDLKKTLIDPCCGSGPFITQALKRVIEKKDGHALTKSDIVSLSQNICGFDINPISVVSAKANFILTVFSSYFSKYNGEDFGEAIDVPIYIADSVLAPVVYSEKNEESIVVETSIGEFELPKFQSIEKSNAFLRILSNTVDDEKKKMQGFNIFWNQVRGLGLVDEKYRGIVENLFNQLIELHQAGHDSFWPIILMNSFAPTMITKKFDYVVGNPPWIAWKSMSKSYRDGTLEVWQSYNIFNKNAYDKKTTHDDFGMAVTYVAVDQYLKEGGNLSFLLPASFLKSTKGGEGFRKLDIVRNGQEIPFAITHVDDFSDVKLFTIPTIALVINKGKQMTYPLKDYIAWTQKGRKSVIDSHKKWFEVVKMFTNERLMAQPVDKKDNQSAWITLPDLIFADKVLTADVERNYRGRKGIEPAGAKGVYVLKTPRKAEKVGELYIENDMSRQRRKDLLEQGEQAGIIEEEFVYPMLGGRNIERWRVKSNEFMLVPHDEKNLYGITENYLSLHAPKTFNWLMYYYQGLLDSRIQNGKFFVHGENGEGQPFYRLDNVGTYTFSPYKVLWKEQTKTMAAVVVGSYLESIPNADEKLFAKDKPIVVDSKILMLATDTEEEAHYVAGIINAPSIREVIDGYAIETNRGTDVLKYVAIPKFDTDSEIHLEISSVSKEIHKIAKETGKNNGGKILQLEAKLDVLIRKIF